MTGNVVMCPQGGSWEPLESGRCSLPGVHMALLAGAHGSSGRFCKWSTSPRLGALGLPRVCSMFKAGSRTSSLSHGSSVHWPRRGLGPCRPLRMEPSLGSPHSSSPGWSQLLSVPCPGSRRALCTQCPSSLPPRRLQAQLIGSLL